MVDRLGEDPDGPVFSVDVNTDYAALSARADRPYLPFFPVMGRERYPLEATPQGYFLDSALELLTRISQPGQPFFLVLSFIGPHWPHVLPEPYWSMYDPASIPSWPNFEEDFQDKPEAHRSSLRHYGVDGWSWQRWAPAVASYFGSISMHDELVGRFVDALDLMGTLLDAASVDVPAGVAPDSLSLMRLLRGERVLDWRSVLVAEFHGDEFGLYSQRMLHA